MEPAYNSLLRRNNTGNVSSSETKKKGPWWRDHSPNSFFFSLRTRIAALAVISSAFLAGIDHLWWAGMMVWLVVQPTRGLLVERMLARVIGAAVGAAILYISASHFLTALLLLTVWIIFFASVGSLFRHLRNYAFVLAAYTAVIIVLFSLSEENSTEALAFYRVICTMIGIVCSALVSVRLPARVVNPCLPALRPVTTLLIAVMFWYTTQWENGAMISITATLFATLFSSHSSGNDALVHVLIGSVIGALAGIVIRTAFFLTILKSGNSSPLPLFFFSREPA